jgi:hypothetical protein
LTGVKPCSVYYCSSRESRSPEQVLASQWADNEALPFLPTTVPNRADVPIQGCQAGLRRTSPAGEQEVPRVLDGEPRDPGEGGHAVLSDNPDVVDDVVLRCGVAAAVVPCQFEQF